MRISSGVVAALAIAAAGVAWAGGDGVKYASPQAAFEQGLGAYKSGYYEIAIPALEEAAANGVELNKFFAEFYLARIYSDNASAVSALATNGARRPSSGSASAFSVASFWNSS